MAVHLITIVLLETAVDMPQHGKSSLSLALALWAYSVLAAFSGSIDLGPPTDTVKESQIIKDQLAGYGIAFEGNWSLPLLSKMRAAVLRGAATLRDFALKRCHLPRHFTAEVFFRKLFGPDTNGGKLVVIQNDAYKSPEGYFARAGNGRVEFWRKVSEVKEQDRVSVQPVDADFQQTFNFEFLALHEISHQSLYKALSSAPPFPPSKKESRYDFRKGENLFRETSAYVARIFLHERGKFISPLWDNGASGAEAGILMGTAGFKYAARNVENFTEYAADAVANWLNGPESFTDDAFGRYRKIQMDSLMARWLDQTLGHGCARRLAPQPD